MLQELGLFKILVEMYIIQRPVDLYPNLSNAEDNYATVELILYPMVSNCEVQQPTKTHQVVHTYTWHLPAIHSRIPLAR